MALRLLHRPRHVFGLLVLHANMTTGLSGTHSSHGREVTGSGVVGFGFGLGVGVDGSGVFGSFLGSLIAPHSSDNHVDQELATSAAPVVAFAPGPLRQSWHAYTLSREAACCQPTTVRVPVRSPLTVQPGLHLLRSLSSLQMESSKVMIEAHWPSQLPHADTTRVARLNLPRSCLAGLRS